ncbi:MAG TPA: ABC transporter permease [Planctomycetota bacterium]|nr:ABC transporter permease [Planctomycetota bacterium]
MKSLFNDIRIIRTRAVARKEFIHVVRDPFSLGMAIGMPIMMLVLFGYALTLDVDNVPLAVWDQSNTVHSRDFIAQFSGSRYFSLRKRAGSYAELVRAIDTREALVAVVVARDFGELIAARRPAPVQVIVDGSDANTATIAIGYAQAVSRGWSERVRLHDSRRIGAAEVNQPLDLRPRVWFNEELESKNFIIPGLISVIMMVIAGLLTSLTIAGEWERGTMEQLVSTPVKGTELIVGKLVPYFAVGMLDVLLTVLMSEFIFHVPLRGSVVLLFVSAAIFMIGMLGIGILISTQYHSQLLASQLAILVTFLPAFLLSGFMFSVVNMPAVVQWVSYLVPARYFVTVIRGIYLKGVGLEVLWLDVALLTAFSALVMALAIVKFKKKLA